MNNEQIEYLLCDAAYLWRHCLSLESKCLGIASIERRIIIKVVGNPGSTQNKIASLLEIDPQNLIRPLDKLVADGLIEKRADTKDRRSNRLFITTACEPMLAKINDMENNIRPKILAGITAADAQQLAKNLATIKENLKGYLDEHFND